MVKRQAIIIGVLTLLVAGSAQPVSPTEHSILDSVSEPLQGRFNQDSGKVRLVLLLSPT